MNLWEKITGSELTKAWRAFEARVSKLPDDYQTSWEEINAYLWQFTNISGRNLIPMLAGVLDLLEETSANGQRVQEVLGDDIKGFCSALVSEEGAKSVRDKWRERTNKNIIKKLGE